MKKSEFNKAMSNLYASFAEVDEVKEALSRQDIVSIYRLNRGDQIKYATITNKNQLNDNYFESIGFEDGCVEAKHLFVLNRKTKCAMILN